MLYRTASIKRAGGGKDEEDYYYENDDDKDAEVADVYEIEDN